jgi:farnesyl-diphosphate farnesyltransferase
VVQTIVGGQELDLCRFDGAEAGRIVALEKAEELDDYTFRVAGCVGEFWTRVCRSHLYPAAPIEMGSYLSDAIRFGKGLQLVNILRDLPEDLRKGRCYVPTEVLSDAALTPWDLLQPSSMERFRPVYLSLLRTAAGHLEAGWRYTCATPRSEVRLRVGCALPLLIGVETLRLLVSGNVLDPSRRLKVSRSRVRSLLFRAFLLHPFPGRWERMFDGNLGLPAGN